jgi:hypothetical protein
VSARSTPKFCWENSAEDILLSGKEHAGTVSKESFKELNTALGQTDMLCKPKAAFIHVF